MLLLHRLCLLVWQFHPDPTQHPVLHLCLLPGLLVILAVPAATFPPVGNWVGAGVAACARPATESAVTKGVRWNRFMARADS